MFSNTWRITKILIASIIFILSGLYAHVEGPRRYPSMEKLVVAPDAFEGREYSRQVCLVGDVDSAGFTFKDKDVYYHASCGAGRVPPSLRKGDFISFRAVFAEGILHVKEWHIHKGRRIKIYVSLVSLAVVLLYFGAFVFRNISPKGNRSNA